MRKVLQARPCYERGPNKAGSGRRHVGEYIVGVLSPGVALVVEVFATAASLSTYPRIGRAERGNHRHVDIHT